MTSLMLMVVSATHTSTIEISPSGWLKPNTEYEFTFSVTNTGGDDISRVIITRPSEFISLTCDDVTGWSKSSNSASCIYDALSQQKIVAGGSKDFTLTVTVDGFGDYDWTLETWDNSPSSYENIVTSTVQTIQNAIEEAEEGDTIEVPSGTYAGAVINKNVKIIGAADGTSVITSGVPYKAGNSKLMSAFRPEVDGAEIRGFTIDCSEDLNLGIYAVEVDNLVVDSLTINSDGTVQGISNWGGSYWTITNNIIESTVASGGGGIGIFMGAKAQQQCTGNLIQFNTIGATATAETYSCAGIAVTLDTRYGGYDLLDGTEDVSGNQILDNIIISSGANNGVGIEVGTILGDGENDPDRTDPVKIGALMEAAAVHDNLVEGNIIDGAETGVYFYIVTDLTVTQNEIKNIVDDGIYVEHAHSGTSVNYNILPSLTNNETTEINAEYNWWGTAIESEIQALIYGDVDYDPWCYDAMCTLTEPHDWIIPFYADKVNLMSIPLIPEDASINSVLGGITQNAEKIWSYQYDEGEGKNKWKYNEPISDGTRWKEYSYMIQEITPGYGYYVFMENNDVIYGDGKDFEAGYDFPSQVTLTTGWNLIGHYGKTPLTLANALWSLAEYWNGDHVYDVEFGQQDTMEPGKAYWVTIRDIDLDKEKFSYYPY